MDTLQLFEELELSTESIEYTRLSEQIDLLNCKVTQLTMEGKVSRSFVESLITQHAVEIDPRYPVGSFTRVPSTTNFTVAQESLVATLGRKFVDMLKEAVKVLIKIFKWIIGFIDYRKQRDKKTPLFVANTAATSKASQDLAEKTNVSLEEEVLKEAVKGYYAQYTGLSKDLLTDGRFVVLLRKLQPQILGLEQIASMRLEAIERMLKHLPKDEGDDLTLMANTRALGDPMGTIQIQTLLKSSGIAMPPNVKSPRELMQSLWMALNVENLNKDLDPMDPTDAIVRLESNRNDILAPILMVPDTIAKSVSAIISKLNILRFEDRSGTTETGRQVIEKLFHSTMDEALAVQVYMNAVNLVAGSRDKLVETLWHYSTFVYESTYKEAVNIGTDEARRITNYNLTNLKAKLKKT